MSRRERSDDDHGIEMAVARGRMMAGFLAKFAKSLDPRRLGDIIRRPLRRARDAMEQRRKRKIRQAIDDRFDREHGVETAGTIPRVSLDTASGNVEHATAYMAVYPEPFLDVMRQLPIDFEQTVFVDFGSGKGRAVLLASHFPFRKIVGVEFSPELHDIAQANLGKYRGPERKCRDIELLCADALEYKIPAGPAVLFFFNPFREEVMAKIAANVRGSLEESARPVYVVYFYPKVGTVWDAVPGLQQVAVRQPEWPTLQGPAVGVWTTRPKA